MTSPLSALPQVADTALPREIREGSADDRKSYKAALGFERVLLDQLVDTMTESQPSLSEGPHAPAIRGALADAIVSQGGLGLAHEIHAAIRSDLQEPS
jgi:hypothetical protein